MLSSKYKNILKNILEEANTPDIRIHNLKILNKVIKYLIKFPSYVKDVYAHTSKSGNTYYIFEMIQYIPRDNNTLIIKTKNAENEPFDYTTDEFYNCHIFTLTEEGGEFDFNYEDRKLIITKDDDEEIEFEYLPYFKNGNRYIINGKITINKLKEELIKKYNIIESELNNTKQSIKNKQRIVTSTSKSLEAKMVENNTDYLDIAEKLSDFGIKESTNGDKSAKVNNIKTETNKGIKYMFNPQNLIGDNDFRKINIIAKKVTETLNDFDKIEIRKEGKKELTPQLVASSIISKLTSNTAAGKAEERIIVDKSMFEDELRGLFDKSLLNQELTGNNDKIKYKKDYNKINWISQSRKDSVLHQALSMVVLNPVEILSPMALLMGNVQWNNETHKAINDIFGNDTSLKNGLIQYPQARNYHLIDSMAVIQSDKDGKYRKLGVSTKGGLNGQGMQASLTSVIQMLINPEIKFNGWGYNDELKQVFMIDKKEKSSFNFTSNKKNDLESEIENFVNKYFTPFGKTLFNENKIGVALIILFGICSKNVHTKILKLLGNVGVLFDTQLIKTNDIKEILEYINNKKLVNNVVMKTLDSWKYKFAQVNCIPNSTGNTIQYTYAIQYPAHFEGTVELKFSADGETVRFHIVGNMS